LKRAARLLGADLVGVCAYDERWAYASRYDRASAREEPVGLPDGLTRVIVVAVAMDHQAIQAGPSALSGVASGLGYSRVAALTTSLAQYVRDLGYQAVASMNDTALAIPLAIQAGLGEYGRSGLLVTRDFGPRVRLGKIFTDLPLVPDEPVRFGVAEFCAVCRRCSRACKIKAIPDGPPTDAPRTRSSLQGVRKWSIDPEKCFQFWANQNSDCSICIRVCPFNKDYARWHNRVGRRLAGTRLRRLVLWLDDRLGYGRWYRASWWWNGAGAGRRGA
jgi:reductive dehalogenase